MESSSLTTFPLEFFKRSAEIVAQDLLGSVLTHITPKGIISGRIVETEAYLENDPASHSFSGITKRNAPMFEDGGIAYIYFTYGMHYCFNVVTGHAGSGEAVLIRALEPLEGVDLMQSNRKSRDFHNLCNGPAKLVQALGINMDFNTHSLTDSPLYIKQGIPTKGIVTAKRIGIRNGTDSLLRFYKAGSVFVSTK